MYATKVHERVSVKHVGITMTMIVDGPHLDLTARLSNPRTTGYEVVPARCKRKSEDTSRMCPSIVVVSRTEAEHFVRPRTLRSRFVLGVTIMSLSATSHDVCFRGVIT